MRILITFHTTFYVLMLEKHAKERGLEGRISPVPRKYSASCGLSWIGPLDTKEALEKLISEKSIDIDKIYEIE